MRVRSPHSDATRRSLSVHSAWDRESAAAQVRRDKFTYKKILFRLKVKPMLYWPNDKRRLTYGEVLLTHVNKVEIQPRLPAWNLQWRLMKMRIKNKVQIVYGSGPANFCLHCIGQHAQAWKGKCNAVHGVRGDDVRGVYDVRGVQ